MKPVDIIIWGDFPPKTHTGISIVNGMVLKILLESGLNVITVEESFWSYSFLRKFLGYIRSSVNLIWLHIYKKIKKLYFNVPLSTSGLFKLNIILFIIKVFSPKTILIGHLHRGDINGFINRNKINLHLLRYCIVRIDKTIVLSDIYCDEILKVNSKANPVVIHNTSSIEDINYSTSNRSYNAKFLCISNYIRSKGIGELVDVFSQHEFASMKLEVIGNVYDTDFYNELILKSAPNIELNESVPNTDLKHKLLAADCFILPSWNEGQPLVLLEAMSVGLPIIATNVGDISNMLGKDYLFLLNPKNIDELKSRVFDFNTFAHKDELGRALFNRYNLLYSNQIFKDNVQKTFI